jgi:hypothetical protein
MRLMLGTKDKPSLLVNVNQEHSPTHFEFWVVNGAWDGTFNNGYITIWDCPSGDFSSLDKIEILTDNQDRLRCGIGEYQEVFNNFSNIHYVAPLNKVVRFDDMDDDIPF